MPSLLNVPVGPRDHVRGPESAPVTVVEYGDFECPQCGAAFPILARVADTFGDRVRFVFRHFPLTNTHPNAQHAAEEAEWASSRGVFWQMHDALYGAQKNLSDRRMLELATELGLPGAELQQSWTTHTFIARVKEDFASGLKSGVTGTPAFFINGVRHEGGWDELSLSHAIEAALK
jgi:protein-disulfide isomerase